MCEIPSNRVFNLIALVSFSNSDVVPQLKL
jgi:hypothetical protein